MDQAQGSSRMIRILSHGYEGVSEYDFETIDSYPDVTIYHLEAINCSTGEFMDWFFETENSAGFCTDGESLIDLGGLTINLTIGQTLSVSFSEWFEAWLDRKVENAKREITREVEKALATIQ